MTDILSKANRNQMRDACAPLSPGIVQPTADAMVIALCAHADAMDALLDEALAVVKEVETEVEACVLCLHGWQREGGTVIMNHAKDCRLAALIAKLKGR